MEKQKELSVVKMMIEFYCHHNHHTKHHELCPECQELYEYVVFRRSKCPWGDNKPFCANCPIHCYKPDMRQKIRDVMRFSGPRITFVHPIIAMRHLIETKKEKKKIAKMGIEKARAEGMKRLQEQRKKELQQKNTKE